MEIILLLLLGGITAGVGLWAALGDKKSDPSSQDIGSPDKGEGPQSSPPLAGLPKTEGGYSGDLGSPIVLGAGDAKKGAAEALRQSLKAAPEQLQAKVVPDSSKPETMPRPPLKVSHKTDDIISPASKYSHHRRALSTADSFVERERAEDALKIYQKLLKRIPEPSIQEKIQKNIEDIERWLSGADMPEDDSIRFPQIVVPLSTQDTAIANLNENLRKISENLLERIDQSIALLQAPPASVPEGAPPAQTSPVSQAAPQGQLIASSSSSSALGEVVALRIGEGLEIRKKKKEGPALPPGFEVDRDGNLITDGWTDEDFEREWGKFKNLPLKDRRSGIERRMRQDRRREKDPRRRDRRSGEDRRKHDLFKEREDFLKKLDRHKKRKKELEEWLEKNKGQKPKDDAEELLTIPMEALLPAEVEEKPPKPPLKEAVPSPQQTETPSEEPPLQEKADEKAQKKPEESPAPLGRLELSKPELRPIGMPEASEPYIEPTPSAATAEAVAEDSSPGMPAFSDGVEEMPDIPEIGGLGGEESEEEKPAPQEIHGVLELKPPEEDDAPFLTLTYDFSKIPDSFKLSADYHTMEFAYYKYKPMLIKAQEFTRRKMLKNALNYYRVIKSQNIPPEFKRMINRNIKDITEYLEKFLMRRS